MSYSRSTLIGMVVSWMLAGLAHAQTPLGSEFTYQGRLVKNSTSVTGTCDFTFKLWNDEDEGDEVGASPQVHVAVQVVDGLFNVSLDFGPAAYDGTPRWLELTVQCTGDDDPTTLEPRQEMKPTPHALALPGLYTQQNAISPNIIGGFSGNTVGAGIFGATISGGGTSGNENSATGNFATVGGGDSNTAGGFRSLSPAGSPTQPMGTTPPSEAAV